MYYYYYCLQFKNKSELSAFFKGFRCTLLYLDLAYKNEKYNEILEMDKQLRDTILAKRTNFSKYIDVLIFGACYKLVNIPNSEYVPRL